MQVNIGLDVIMLQQHFNMEILVLGFFACQQKLVRLMPGRMVGITRYFFITQANS